MEIRNVGKKFSRYPLFSAFSDAPMGHNSNNIGNSPVDMLHTLWGGLCKNMCGFVLAITYQIGRYSTGEGFVKILETLDHRISIFPKVYENVPHIQWTYFPNGLVTKLFEGIADGKSNTGKGGGFRSAHFIPALLQIYFCLENLLPVNVTLIKSVKSQHDGDLETGRKRETISKKLCFVGEVVKRAIESLLHLHFELCRDYWNDQLRKKLKILVSSMKSSYCTLWKMKEESYFREATNLPGWKVHDCDHFPCHIEEFGPVSGWETGPFEMFNKVTKDLWRKTSGRKKSESIELLKQDFLRTLLSYHDDKQALLSGRYCTERLILSDVSPEKTEFHSASSDKKSICSILSDNRGFQIIGDICSDAFQRFLISFETFNVKMELFFQEQNFTPFDNFRLFKRDRVTIIGSKDSSLKSVLIHAYLRSETDSLDESNVKIIPWFDFVLVQGLSGKQFLAQVMGIFEIWDVSNESSHFCFFVKYLERLDQKERDRYGQNRSDSVSYEQLYTEYHWASGPNRCAYDVGIVSQDSIADIAFVVPSFLNNLSSHHSSNHSDDKFFFIHRKFFDRSGWTMENDISPLQDQNRSSRVSSSSSIVIKRLILRFYNKLLYSSQCRFPAPYTA